MSNFDDRFIKDEKLHRLLEQWKAPDVPESLDNRVTAAYNSLMGNAAARLNSGLSPEKSREVVPMKFCKTCQEEFAERFSFCPVDGTPLSTAPIQAVSTQRPDIETTYPVAERESVAPIEVPTPVPVTTPIVESRPAKPAPSLTQTQATSARTQGNSEDLHLTFLEDTGLLTRLASKLSRQPKVVFDTPAAYASGAPAHENIGEYHLTMLQDTGLLTRLAGELGNVAHNYQLTWPEFKRDPFGFTKRSIQGYGSMVGRFFSSRDVVLAMGISILALAAVIVGVVMIDRTQSAGASRIGLVVFALAAFCGLIAIFATQLSRDRGAAVMGARPSDSRNVLSGIVTALVLVFGAVGLYVAYDRWHQGSRAVAANSDDEFIVQNMIDIPNEQPTPDEGTAGMAKGNGGGSKPKQEKAGGGGGGGREQQAPASFGKLPQADLRIPQVVAPNPNPPPIKNPALPMPATLDADPVLFPPDTRQLNYGDPKSKSTATSSGPGTGGGIGTGTGGGVGPGEGGGYGPGRGGNTGGGDRHEGGGGPGGGGGGTDYSRIFSGKEVSSKARVLDKPEPTYTEAARKNQITGTVVLRAVFSSSGSVTNIHAVSGLPDGLTERAIAAAKQIRFIPAQKDGHPVSMWMELQYNFNLY
jgi:TonB family protein